MMRRNRRVLFVLLLALVPCGGCVWLKNEFFVYDRAAPAPAEPVVDASPTSPW